VSGNTRPMKCPMRGRQPGHHTTPAFARERARRPPTPALCPGRRGGARVGLLLLGKGAVSAHRFDSPRVAGLDDSRQRWRWRRPSSPPLSRGGSGDGPRPLAPCRSGIRLDCGAVLLAMRPRGPPMTCRGAAASPPLRPARAGAAAPPRTEMAGRDRARHPAPRADRGAATAGARAALTPAAILGNAMGRALAVSPPLPWNKPPRPGV
jgi:hypothetical protein